MKFSRRGFLSGAVAVATAAALPVLVTSAAPAKLVVDPKTFARGGILKMPMWSPDRPHWHYCLPGEWKRIAATGYDMHDCVLVGQIPTPKVRHARR